VAKASALAADRDWRSAETAVVVIAADRHRLTQALLNLAKNAVQHSAAGSTVSLGSRAVGDEVRFWVKDEGEGIPAAERTRIFERFSRGRGGPRRSDGAGLGLAIVEAIAEAHGGRVELASTPGGPQIARSPWHPPWWEPLPLSHGPRPHGRSVAMRT
jgi:signal transduction histidine kinase